MVDEITIKIHEMMYSIRRIKKSLHDYGGMKRSKLEVLMIFWDKIIH